MTHRHLGASRAERHVTQVVAVVAVRQRAAQQVLAAAQQAKIRQVATTAQPIQAVVAAAS